MKRYISVLAIYFIVANLAAQATGNVIYNSNNRFQQNNYYKSNSRGGKYRSAAPEVDYYNKNLGLANADGDFMMSAYNESNSEVIFNINVLFNAKPTGYMAIFHINQAGKKITDLDTLVGRRIEKFISLAKNIGITRENFYVDMIALVPIFREDKRNNTKPKGFEIQKNIHIKYYDAGQLEKLFSYAAQCEIYDLIKVEYLYSESEKAGADMHAKAIQMLQSKIDYFKKIGMNIDTAKRKIGEFGNVYFPIDKYTSYQPLAVNSLDDEDKPATEQELMKTRTGMITHTTVFYNPTDLTGFDAVINPNPLEPPIQFTYSLQVRYKMTDPAARVETKTETVHELLIVTPNGDVKTVVK